MVPDLNELTDFGEVCFFPPNGIIQETVCWYFRSVYNLDLSMRICKLRKSA